MKEINNIQRIVGNLSDIFNKANRDFFKNTLKKPMITCNPERGAYGSMSVYNIWSDKMGNGYRELNVNPEDINRPLENVVATVLHEMVHCSCKQVGIKETSGYYHNKKFKEEAEKLTLEIEHHKNYGWTITHPTDATIEWICKNDIRDFEIVRNTLWMPTFGAGLNLGTTKKGGDAPKIEKPKKK